MNSSAVDPACREALPKDFPALRQMLELYQYELSDIWRQDTDAEARYGYDLTRHQDGGDFRAYVALVFGAYAGFALVSPAWVTRREGWWMEQFFVMKRYRRSGLGARLARHVLADRPGPWEVGQMFGNLGAQAFWRRVIPDAATGQVVECHLTSGVWRGVVQQFNVNVAPSLTKMVNHPNG